LIIDWVVFVKAYVILEACDLDPCGGRVGERNRPKTREVTNCSWLAGDVCWLKHAERLWRKRKTVGNKDMQGKRWEM